MSQISQWLGLPWYTLVPVVLAVGWISQEASRAFAVSIGLLDYPNSRKIHSKPIPLSGGPGIFAPLFIAYLGWMFMGSPGMAFFPALALGLGFGAIFFTGLIDDKHGISARKRLVIQAGVAVLLWSAGFRLDDIAFGSWTLHLGLLSLPLTMFWFMGFMNTSNLMDGMDGLSGGMNLIALVALGASCIVLGLSQPCLAASLAALTLVYLFFNLRRGRKVFLGDSGSLTLGLSVAVLSVISFRNGSAVPAVLPAVALGGYLVGITDVVSSISRRVKAGASPFAPDKQHLHHRLLRRGFGRFSTLLILHVPAVLTFAMVLTAFIDMKLMVITSVLHLFAALSLLITVVPDWRQRTATAPPAAEIREFPKIQHGTVIGQVFSESNPRRAATPVVRDRVASL